MIALIHPGGEDLDWGGGSGFDRKCSDSAHIRKWGLWDFLMGDVSDREVRR